MNHTRPPRLAPPIIVGTTLAIILFVFLKLTGLRRDAPEDAEPGCPLCTITVLAPQKGDLKWWIEDSGIIAIMCPPGWDATPGWEGRQWTTLTVPCCK